MLNSIITTYAITHTEYCIVKRGNVCANQRRDFHVSPLSIWDLTGCNAIEDRLTRCIVIEGYCISMQNVDAVTLV